MSKNNSRRGILFGLGVLGLGALAYGNRRVDEWENRTTNDAPDGHYMMLADGTRVHYIVEGHPDGEAVIFIHGWRDSAYTWHKNVSALSPYYRVYALDLPGFGYSTRYSEAIYTISQFADWVAQFIESLQIPRAHLIGNSLGGATALKLSYERPDLVNKLVVEDAWAYPLFEELAWFIRLLPRFVSRGLVGLVATNRRILEVFSQRSHGDARRYDPSWTEIVEGTSRVRGSIDALMAMAGLPRGHDVWRGFDRCQSETLVIWGERDLTFPVSHGERLARELKNARLVVLPKAGHVPHAEFPEEVNKLLLEFLREGPRAELHES